MALNDPFSGDKTSAAQWVGGFERGDNFVRLPFKVRISNGPWTYCFSIPLLRRLDLVYLRLP